MIKVALRKTLPDSVIDLLLREVKPRLKSASRGPLAWWRGRLPPLKAESLHRDLERAGIAAGDVVMVHSSLSRVGNVEGGASTVIQSLMDAVGPGGTLIMPFHVPAAAVMESVARGEVFDMRSARPVTGIITETFSLVPGVLRSSHPFASCCAWGRHAAYVTRDHDRDARICHKDSPLGRLLELRGKLVGIGVSIGPVGFYHVLEDTWDEFPFEVYLPAVEVRYIDSSGRQVQRPIKRYDPHVARARIEKPETEGLRRAFTQHLARKGILRFFTYGRASAWVMETEPLYNELLRLARRGITIYSAPETFRNLDDPSTH